jgi:RNA polymerase sigma-70 factor, ECF subfamily
MEEDARWRGWLTAAQGGDRLAYATLLAAVLPWLRARAHARWRQANTAEVEDIVQETLLALHRSLALYDPSRPVAPFLYGILKLRGAEVRRQRHRHTSRETFLDDLPVTSSVLATKASQETAMDVQAVTTALHALSARDREILEMLKLHEMSLREASAVTGMSIAALKVATFRAMQRLRRLMGVADAD